MAAGYPLVALKHSQSAKCPPLAEAPLTRTLFGLIKPLKASPFDLIKISLAPHFANASTEEKGGRLETFTARVNGCSIPVH